MSAGDDLRVDVTEELFSSVEEIYGEGSVKIEVGMGPPTKERRKVPFYQQKTVKSA